MGRIPVPISTTYLGAVTDQMKAQVAGVVYDSIWFDKFSLAAMFKQTTLVRTACFHFHNICTGNNTVQLK